MADENFEDDAVCTGETAAALRVIISGESSPRWIPKSVVHDDSEVFDATDNNKGLLVIKGWWARKEGLM